MAIALDTDIYLIIFSMWPYFDRLSLMPGIFRGMFKTISNPRHNSFFIYVQISSRPFNYMRIPGSDLP